MCCLKTNVLSASNVLGDIYITFAISNVFIKDFRMGYYFVCVCIYSMFILSMLGKLQ